MKGEKHLVLVVDDDMDLRCTVAQILREEGFRVREARNGREALAKIADEEPDLVVLDLMMPAVNGWEVLEALRVSRRIVPVVILSALPAEGRDDYIEKPVTFARLFQLLDTVRARVKTSPVLG